MAQSLAHNQRTPTPPKSGKARTVAMASDLREALAAHIDARRFKPDSYLFTKPRSREPITRSSIKRAYRRVSELARLRPLRLHDMRHTFASQLVLKGVPLTVVRDLMGHADIATTMIYAHLRPDEGARWVERLVSQGGDHA